MACPSGQLLSVYRENLLAGRAAAATARPAALAKGATRCCAAAPPAHPAPTRALTPRYPKAMGSTSGHMCRCRCRGYCSPKLLEEAPADQNIRLFQRLQPQISSPHFVHRRDLPDRFENHIVAGFVPSRERWADHGRGDYNSKSRRLLTNSKSRRLLGLVREANCVD